MIWLQDPDFTLYNGDALEVLRTLPDESVDCCITSPPYWGLRDYGTGTWEGGDEGCDHQPPKQPDRKFTNGRGEGKDDAYAGSNLKAWTERDGSTYRDTCRKCGATRIDNQLGLEPTPEEYVTRMVEVFREVRRVLADHGTLWLNMGDSYMGGGGGNYGTGVSNTHGQHLTNVRNRPDFIAKTGCKAKDLVGVPWLLAFALRADGWYLRSDIVWSKPNPMPESVTDRPTKAHEYVFLLSKQPRYFFDQETVREPAEWARWGDQTVVKPQPGTAGWIKPKSKQELVGKRTYDGFNGRWDEAVADGTAPTGRNIRSVWEIATQPFPEAHFATFPEELVRRCLLAGCPEGGVVLDPFLGSGTVALVARKHGRRCVGIELNPEYCEMITRRTQQLSLLADEGATIAP